MHRIAMEIYSNEGKEKKKKQVKKIEATRIMFGV